MSEDLYTKYRPQAFDEVVGHDAVVKSVQQLIKSGTAHSFLFTGPSGVGKTTLARIIAKAVGCAPNAILEIDAATYNGIDDIREITKTIGYKAFGTSSNRMVIIDECHALSQPAWQAVLKSLEEPPSGVYWCLCTTNVGKVPPTVKTRCATYDLKPVSTNDITDLLEVVAREEGLKVESFVDLLAAESGGSPRQALVYLSMCATCTSRKEAAEVIKSVAESDGVIELCRLLASGKATWAKAIKILEPIKDQDPEGIRLVVTSYFTTILLKEKNDGKAAASLAVLEAFSGFFNRSEKMAPVLLALGNLLLGGGDE